MVVLVPVASKYQPCRRSQGARRVDNSDALAGEGADAARLVIDTHSLQHQSGLLRLADEVFVFELHIPFAGPAPGDDLRAEVRVRQLRQKFQEGIDSDDNDIPVGERHRMRGRHALELNNNAAASVFAAVAEVRLDELQRRPHLRVSRPVVRVPLRWVEDRGHHEWRWAVCTMSTDGTEQRL